jgi:hypothetical protein
VKTEDRLNEIVRCAALAKDGGPGRDPSQILVMIDLEFAAAKALAAIDLADRIIRHCESMNILTREEAWFAEELGELKRE